MILYIFITAKVSNTRPANSLSALIIMKKILKISGIIFLSFLLLLTVLYVYITNNAERLIKNIVSSQSGGLYSLEMKKIELDLRHLHLAIDEPHFSSNDSLHQYTTYDIRTNRLSWISPPSGR